MSTTPRRFLRFGTHWLTISSLLGFSLINAGAIAYFAWAAQSLPPIAIAETVGTENQVFVNEQSAKPGTSLTTGQQISTRQAVKVGLKRTDQVVARLGEASSAILERDCIQRVEGRLVFTELSGCVGAAIVTPQNAIVVLERLGTLADVKVLSGEATLTVPSNPGLGKILLKANQKVTLNLTGDEIGAVRLMLPSDVQKIVDGDLFQGFQLAIANQTTLTGLLPTPSPTPQPSPTPHPQSSPPTPSAVSPAPPVAQMSSAKAPQPQAAHLAVPTINRTLDYAALSKPDSSPIRKHAYDRSPYPDSGYSRSSRRRRYVEPEPSSYADSYSPRKRWTRSPYSGSYSRRHSPSYTPPYSAPSYSAPSDSAPSHPVPSQESPSLPEAPVMELPTPIELPPPAAVPESPVQAPMP